MNTDVIIVGGGPVGLTMMLMLQYHGVDAILIDKGNGIITYPRVGTVGVRSMEIFRKLGISGKMQKSGWPEDHPLDISWTTSLGGHELLRIKRGTYNDRLLPTFSPETEQVCPHHWLCPILLKEIADTAPKSLLLNTKMISFTQSDTGVIVKTQNTKEGTQSTIQGKYLIACDGARSSIREQCDVTFEQFHESNHFQNILFEAPYLKNLLGTSNALVHFLVSPTGLRYPLRSMDGRSLYRITVKPQKDKTPYELVNMALNYETPFYIKSNVHWELSHRIVDKYRDKRIFFAGDAAHVISPSGGFGMNTGVADTENLAWKISEVLKGNADERILDSYHDERRPIALKSLEKSKENLSRTLNRKVPTAIALDTSEGGKCRKEFTDVLIKQQVGKEFDAPDVHLGLGYSSDLIDKKQKNTADKNNTPNNWQKSAMVGYRAPHVFIGKDQSIIDLFGKNYVILCFGTKEELISLEKLIADALLPIQARLVTDEDAKKIYQEKYFLIRPDGYISWKNNGLNEDTIDQLKTVCRSRNKQIAAL
ncbi:FAD-dependent monooxygenase [Aquimarina sp. RZ0]|uniref:FAD-dependent monooxygenase n=1 Tax=Aquimarina sp. RZ0 TaxID=2607730 RepID=UPI0011F2BC68|nr:FAD-dependent monooxygenase [Aquimarina sp. RZ0]KAA1247014.1 FAD-binding monooxygenase [Aquimarina sp. RZ0]